MRKIYLILTCFFFTVSTKAGTITWDNTVTTGDWASGSSWVGGVVPGAGDDVVFNGAPNVLVTFAANVSGVLSISIINGSTVTFRTATATNYTLGATTAPILTIDGTSVFQQGTVTPVSAAAGGVNISISGTSLVAAGGTIRQLSGSGSRITVIAGATFNINGSFYCQSELIGAGPNYSNAAFITNANAATTNLNFNAGAYVEINRNTGLPSTMPYANWDATATLKITGNITTTAGVHTWQLNGTTPQKLGNFIFDCPNLAPSAFSLTLNNSTQVLVDEFKGDVQILNSNGKIVAFASTNSVNQTITFKGNLTIGSGVADFRPMNSATANTGVVTWNCEKSVSIAPATFGMNANTSTAHVINLTGTASQNLGLPTFATNGIFSINVNNGGTGATLSSNTGNLKNITLTNGKLTLGNFNAVAGYNAGTVSGNATNYVVTNGTGKITVVNAPAATSTLFPVGISSSSYDPVRVNPTNTADFSINVRDASAGFTNPEANASLTCNREWDINTPGTPGSTLVEFEPDPTTGGCPGSGTKVVGHYTGGAWTETTSAAGPNFSYSASFSSFSPFGVGVQAGFFCITPNAGTVSGASPLCIGATDTYTSNGDAGGSWSSTNTLVATVNPTTGLVTALAAGTTDITYTVTNACGSAPAFKTLTVDPNISAGTVSGTSPLCAAQTATYTSDGTSGGTWSSTNTLVATVNPTTGLVTAIATGTTDITYTVNSGCGAPVSSFKTLTVGTTANAGTVSGQSPLSSGMTATYTSNGDAGGSWSSTNTLVATVNPTTGFVTAVAAGTTDITYTINTGCGAPVSSFKTLTVNNTNTWIGASGSDWLTASNWSLGFVPIATNDVVFNGFAGTVKFLSINTVAPCASLTVTGASDVIFEDQDNGADSIGTANSPCVMTVTGNSALRSRTVGTNSLTGGVVVNTTGASMIAAGSTFDMKSGTFNKIIMRSGTLDVNGTILVGNETIALGVSNSGFINRIAGTLNFGPGSLVEANRTSGLSSSIPLANWDATSTIRIINCTGTAGLTSWATGGTHSLGNLVIDASGMNIPVYNLGFSSATALLVNEIKGNFTVLNANGKIITLSAITAAGNTQAQTVTFRGNVSVSNAAALRAFNYTGSGSGSGVSTWNFEKNVTLPQVGVSINSSTAHVMNFTGSTSQTLSLGGFETNGIFSLNVNNGGNGVSLNANTGNLKNITLTNGKLTLGNFNAVAGYNTGTVSGNTTNYIVTNGTGVLTINNVTTGNTFPIGNSKYNPLIIENGSGHNWSAKVSDGITADPGFNTDKAVLVTWDITPSVNPPASGADITFQFDETTQTGVSFNIGTNIQAWRRPSSSWIASGSPAAAAGSAGARTVKVTGLTGFSSFGLSNIDGPLPVSLLSFSGERVNTNNVLRWTTAAEINNLGFEVQRSDDGVNYSAIGFVNTQAAGGNSNSLLSYIYTDLNTTAKKYYYRLRQVDIDNHSRFSKIVLIKGDTPLTLVIEGLFPNPASSNVNLIINTPDRKKVTILVTDINGRLIKSQQAAIENGSNTVNMNVTKFSSGTYIVKVVCASGCETESIKLIKQ